MAGRLTEKRRAKAKAIAVPRQSNDIIPLALGALVVMAIGLAFLSSLAKGSDLIQPANTLGTKDLEVAIWTAEEEYLYDLEKRVVRYIQENPKSSYGHYLLSHLLTRIFAKDPGDLRLLSQASDMAQQAIDLDPKKEFGYIALADVLDLMGRPERGLQLLQEAKKAGVVGDWRLAFTEARLNGDAKSTVVLNHLNDALTAPDAKHEIIIPYITAVLHSNYAGNDLIAQLSEWYRKAPHILFLQSTAITYSEIKDYERAHEIYAQIYGKDIENKEAMINDAVILYKYLNKSEKAIALLKKVLKDHHRLSPRLKSIVHAHMGAAAVQLGNYKVGEASFVESIAISDSDEQIIDFMMKSYNAKRAFNELVAVMTSMNQRMPGSSLFHAILAETLSEKLGKHDDSLVSFSNAIALEPDRSDLYNGMGLVYYRQQKFDKALQLFTTATQVDPNDATAWYNEACAFALTGNSNRALGSLQEALTLDPTLQGHARTDADLSSLHRDIRFHEIVDAQTDDGDLAEADELSKEVAH